MKRRDFLTFVAALPLAGALAMPARAAMLDYAPGMVSGLLAEGRTLFVDFAADWCSTCRTQERIIERLRAGNPAYDAALTFVRVDWDDFGNSDIVRQYAIPRRSTLLVLKGERELGRLVADTREANIAALLDTGLRAANGA
jgi:thiol-disulfide isomerase/thioredoxin